ncbi:hypothetical protein [Nocardioides sp.]|uniref:hypothetical protein n=1 Tax=Nocardioides sp. TaxID=35761 RepID=UPI0035190D87
MISHVRRLAGFALLPAFSLMASLVLLPLVASNFGPAGWVSLGTGISVGAVLTIICGLAWASIGGHRVAVGDAVERRRLFWLSLSTRGIVLAAALPIATAIIWVVDVDDTGAAWLFMVGLALNSFSMSWFYGGTENPGQLAVNEGVVRLSGYALATAALAAGAPLATYAALNVVASLVTLGLNTRSILRITAPCGPISRAEHLAELRVQFDGTLARSGFAFFTLGGPTIFALGAAASLAHFNAVDQMLKTSVSATSILPQAFIAVAAAGVAARVPLGSLWTRRPEALVLTWLPLAALLTWCALGPVAADFLFAGKLELDRGTSVLIGVALASTMTLRSFELLIMFPRDLAKPVFTINAWWSFAAVAALYLSARLDSVELALGVWIGVHLVVYVMEVQVLRRRMGDGHLAGPVPHDLLPDPALEMAVAGDPLEPVPPSATAVAAAGQPDLPTPRSGQDDPPHAG